MSDKNNREVPIVPEQPDKHLKTLDLLLPDMSWQQNLGANYLLTSRKQEKYRKMAQRFAESSTIVVLAGMWGLGDSVIETRFATHIAKSTDKQVICQVPAPLLPFGEGIRVNLPQLMPDIPKEVT